MFGRASHPSRWCPVGSGSNEKTVLLSTYSQVSDSGCAVAKDTESNDDVHSTDRKITTWEAIVNISNAIQGVVIVNYPYALLLGGYWAVITMIVFAIASCYTGKALIRCMYDETDQGKVVRVRSSYGEIGQEVFGHRLGGKIVNCVLLVQIIGDCTTFLVFSGMLFNSCFPGLLSARIWIVICGLVLLPTAYIKIFKDVYWISLGKMVGIVVFCLIVIVYCFTEVRQWDLHAMVSRSHLSTLPLYYGIVSFSYSGHPYMPTVEDHLQDRGRYNYVINVSHLAMTVLKVVFSIVTFLAFGIHTEETVTDSIHIYGLKLAVNLFLIMGTLLTYPMVFFVAVDILESRLQREESYFLAKCCNGSDKATLILSVTLRTIAAFLTLLISVGLPHFMQLVSVIGSFTGTVVTFLWPCTFHLKLKWFKLRWYQKLTDLSIIIFSAIFGGVSLYYSFEALFSVL